MDDTEKATPTTPVQGEAGNKPAEAITLDADFGKIQQELQEAKNKLEEKNLQAQQLTDEIRRLRLQAKEPLVKPQEQFIPSRKDDDDDFKEVDDFDLKYQQRRLEERKQEYISRVNRCFDRFSREKEFDGEVDMKFRKLANRMNLGDSDEEVIENFQVIYAGLVPSSGQKKEEDNKVIAVGDGGFEEPIRDKSNRANWLNKKLNRFEMAAAANFPGGETAYRKKMQDISDREK